MCMMVSDIGSILQGFFRACFFNKEVDFGTKQEDKHAHIKPQHRTDDGCKASVKQGQIFGVIYVQREEK